MVLVIFQTISPGYTNFKIMNKFKQRLAITKVKEAIKKALKG